MRASWRWLPWLALVVVAGVVLVVGTHRASHPTRQQETMHIAGMVRCPVCEGESAAESQAPASVQIRNQIQQELGAGESQSQILAGLVAAYGPAILEKPEARGVGLVLWVLPVLAVVAACAGLAVAFSRWRPRRAGSVTPEDRALVEQALGRQRPGTDGEQGGEKPEVPVGGAAGGRAEAGGPGEPKVTRTTPMSGDGG